MAAAALESLSKTSLIPAPLHGNDSELIFLIDPDEESLGVIVENTSSGWPVSVKTAGFEESVSFLEEEVIFDKLLLVLSRHTFKWVEFTLEISLEFSASLNDLVHDVKSLFFGDSWSKWEFSEVSSNSDSSGLDHGGVLFTEVWAGELTGVHVGDMLVTWSMLVVVLNNLVEEVSELSVGIVGSGIGTDSRVNILNSRENASFERYTKFIGFIVVFVPDILSKIFADERFSSFWEDWKRGHLLWALEVASGFDNSSR